MFLEPNQSAPGATVNSTDALASHQLTPLNQHMKIAAYVLLMIFSLTGNFLVILVVYKRQELHKSAINFLIVNMAVSDIIFSRDTIPFDIVRLASGDRRQWLLGGNIGDFFCKFIPFTLDVTAAVSVLSMILIAVERLRAVVFPLKRQCIPNGHCARFIILTWLVGAICFAPIFYRFGLIIDNVGTYHCAINWEPLINTEKGETIFQLTSTITFLLVPLLFLTTIYTIIVAFLHRRKNTSVYLSSIRRRPDRKASRGNKTTLMLILIVLAYFISYVPISIVSYLFLFQRRALPTDFITLDDLVFGLLFFFRTYLIANPVIYFVFNDRYRRGLKKLASSYNWYRYSFSFLPSSCKSSTEIVLKSFKRRSESVVFQNKRELRAEGLKMF